MGRKRLAFVEEALAGAKRRTELIPGRIKMPLWEAKFNLARTLADEVREPANSLASDIDDTIMSYGSEAVQLALEYKKLVQDAARRDPAYQDEADRLAALLTEADQAGGRPIRAPPRRPVGPERLATRVGGAGGLPAESFRAKTVFGTWRAILFSSPLMLFSWPAVLSGSAPGFFCLWRGFEHGG